MTRQAVKRHVGEIAREIFNNPPTKYVKVENGAVGFPDYSYWIELRHIPNEGVLIEWVLHLSEKNWITKEHIAQFIEAVCHCRSWGRYHGNQGADNK